MSRVVLWATLALVAATGVRLVAAAEPGSKDVEALERAGLPAEARAKAEIASGEKAHWVGPTGTGAVKAVAWAPDGRSLIVSYHGPLADDACGVSLLDSDGWREAARFADEPCQPVDAVAFASDGTVATASFVAGARLWDRTGRERSELDCGHGGGESGSDAQNGASGVGISPDGKSVVAACSDGAIRTWSIDRGQVRPARPLSLNAAFSSVAFGMDGDTFVWGTVDGHVGLANLTRGHTRRLGAHELTINSVGLNVAGTTLVSSSKDGDVRLWNVASGKVRRRLRTDGGLAVPAAISPDGKLVVTAGPGDLRFWDAAKGTLLDRKTSVANESPSQVLSFRPDGVMLAVGSASGLAIWDVERRAPVVEIPALGDTGAYALAFAPGGRQLAVTGVDGLRLWGLDGKGKRGELIERRPHVGGWMDIVFGADGSTAGLVDSPAGRRPHASSRAAITAMGEPDGSIAIVDRTGKTVRSLQDQPPPPRSSSSPAFPSYMPPAFMALGFNLDGLLLAAGADNGKVVLWDPVAGRRIALLRPPGKDSIASVAVSADGGEVAVGTTQGSVEIWTVASRKLARTIDVTPGYPQAIAFSPDGTRMGVGLSRKGTLLFARPSYQPTARLTAVPDRDAAFWQALPPGSIMPSGTDSKRFLSCRAGRFLLPAESCKGL